MVNYNQAYLESLVKPGSTRLSILVNNRQKRGKSGSARVYQAHQAFNQTIGASVSVYKFFCGHAAVLKINMMTGYPNKTCYDSL